MNDPAWAQSLEIPPEPEFEPDISGWGTLFSKLNYVMDESGLSGKLGGCFHLLSRAPKFLINMDLMGEFREAQKRYRATHGLQSLEIGLHCTTGIENLVLGGNFAQNLAKDIQIGEAMGATSIVEHAPEGPNNVIKEAVEELATDPVIKLMQSTNINFCWENKACYPPKKNRFFGSIKAMVEFRIALMDKLKEIGHPELIVRNIFCFDTGHLLTWRQTHIDHYDVDKEIEEYLPEFAKHIKVFHIHINSGRMDNHTTPFATEFLDHPTRKGMTEQIVQENSARVMEWLKICNEHKGIEGRHLHLEATSNPFTLDHYITFAKQLNSIL